ncbi:hypothetical protein [Nonomuraea sp. NEAU-A123]|uniref:hypothetical protein n=1 Tax=Nonomuraea sp. NEAU-A123 TaxID=2839649 RepID=UPI001BE44152|nr:hypothetical protein [Nonomuraea sp. NEAU-A123]MBT2224573.1 hypothetical protein [Nonomuraea sp. NEAU-A123]
MPLAPAVIVPKAANVVIGTIVAALLIVPVVLLRHRRWASRLGAALLALLAVAAAMPPITGLGKPSEEEIQRYLAIQNASGGPADINAGAPQFLPWDDNDLLLLAIACLAAAALLLALDRTVHREEPRELLPLRWRWPLVMWGIALVLVSIPQTMFLTALADGSIEYSIMIMDGDCVGGMGEILYGPATAVLILIPQPIVVAVGFGLWALLARTGHRPLGRVVGWLTVVPLVVRDMMMNWMPALGCAESSEEATNPITLTWALYTLLPVVLIVLAVRVHRALAPEEKDQPAARWS